MIARLLTLGAAIFLTAGSCPGSTPVDSVAASKDFTCATRGGQVWCWGQNSSGQVVPGTAGRLIESSPVLVPGLSDIKQVAMEDTQAYALASDGGVYRWGKDGFGNITKTPTKFSLNESAAQISAAGQDACFVDNAQNLLCGGQNPQGQLGKGDKNSSGYFTKIRSGVLQVATNAYQTFILLANGQVFGAGSDSIASLGIGTPAGSSGPDQPIFVQLAALQDITQISTRSGTSFALNKAGKLFRWGNLGPGNYQTAPKEVAGLSGPVVSVSAGSEFACAIVEGGDLYCWGVGGALGLGNFDNQKDPQKVTGLSNVKSVSCGSFHACAITGDGKLYCWGRHYEGQVGNGKSGGEFLTDATSTTPQLIQF